MKTNEFQKLAVGETLTVSFKAVENKEGFSCDKCCFKQSACSFIRKYLVGECSSVLREDVKDVYFVEENRSII